jgi:hypothetical protein
MVAPASAAIKNASRTSGATKSPAGSHDGDDAIVVHVRDAASGEIDIFRGESQTSVHDRALAARIVRASQ